MAAWTMSCHHLISGLGTSHRVTFRHVARCPARHNSLTNYSPNVANKDPAIHNYLVSLYAKQPDDSRLLKFLERWEHEPQYDLKYALRLCTQEGKKRVRGAIFSKKASSFSSFLTLLFAFKFRLLFLSFI
jgi:hypothetical protein